STPKGRIHNVSTPVARHAPRMGSHCGSTMGTGVTLAGIRRRALAIVEAGSMSRSTSVSAGGSDPPATRLQRPSGSASRTAATASGIHCSTRSTSRSATAVTPMPRAMASSSERCSAIAASSMRRSVRSVAVTMTDPVSSGPSRFSMTASTVRLRPSAVIASRVTGPWAPGSVKMRSSSSFGTSAGSATNSVETGEPTNRPDRCPSRCSIEGLTARIVPSGATAATRSETWARRTSAVRSTTPSGSGNGSAGSTRGLRVGIALTWPEAPCAHAPTVTVVETHTHSVAELNARILDALSGSFPDEVWVQGEIHGFSTSARGHTYFNLVEPGQVGVPTAATVSVVLFGGNRRAVDWLLRKVGGLTLGDGLQVRIRGEVTFYPPQGRVQLRMTSIDPRQTLGAMAIERDRLLRRPAEEGLLERNRTVPLSPVPLRVALVTSDGSAAAHDVIHELESSGHGFRVT